MRGRPRRTLMAALLTTAAVAVPCAAWWTAGSRAVERERAALVAGVEADARRHAVHLAERLHGRLDALARHEAQRPYFEYAYRYQDPNLSCECATWVESPLARGASEPLIWTHFELDRRGQLTIPSIPPPEKGSLPAGATSTDPAQARAAAQLLREVAGDLARAAWRAERSKSSEEDAAVTVAYGDETVFVESFRWHSVEIEDQPRLLAVRTVVPPSGRRLQGFVISTDALEAAVRAGPYPAVLRPSEPGPGASPRRDATSTGPAFVTEGLGLEGADWEIALDLGDGRREAVLRGDDQRRQFERVFAGGSGAAALAAILLVGLVAQSERTARDRSRFAASAAHELRTPLAGLRVYGEMLADDLGDPDHRRNYARQIASEADRLSRVVSNVLGHTKLERGTLTLKARTGDLSAAVREAVDRLRPTLECQGATLELEMESPLPAVPFDDDALGQMLANLVDNAERYSRASSDRRVHVRVRAQEDGVAIEVSDHGTGIPVADRKHLFRPFGRGADPNAPGGLGLGLAMVAQLARAHGGHVRCDGVPGGGSLFAVYLPA